MISAAPPRIQQAEAGERPKNGWRCLTRVMVLRNGRQAGRRLETPILTRPGRKIGLTLLTF